MAEKDYEEMIKENESRKIDNEEQRARIESMESNVRRKAQELFTLTSNFNDLKKDNDETHAALEQTNCALHQTEIVVQDTKRSLEKEEALRKVHASTEMQLHEIGTDLLSTLNRTVGDVNGLHEKVQRKEDLHITNRDMWQAASVAVLNNTDQIRAKLETFQQEHLRLLGSMSGRINAFIGNELGNIQESCSRLEEFSSSFGKAEAEAKDQTSSAHEEMNGVLEEIKVLREDVKEKVGEGLNGLSTAAARISGEVVTELSEYREKVRITVFIAQCQYGQIRLTTLASRFL